MNALTDDMKIACCKTCSLADVMKDCKTCPFNVGLPFRLLDRARIEQSKQEHAEVMAHVLKVKNSLFKTTVYSNPNLTPA